MADGSNFPLISDPNAPSNELDNFTPPQKEWTAPIPPQWTAPIPPAPPPIPPVPDQPPPIPNAPTPSVQAPQSWQTGPLQWLRRISLVVYGSASGGGNSGLDLSQLRVDFRLQKQTNSSPNFLEAKVYNLSPETLQLVKQYKRVQLSAGYDANFGMIFDGTVVIYIVGKDNPVDSYLEIIGGDLDEQLNNKTVNLNFPPGTKPDQQMQMATQQIGVPVGHIDGGQGQQPTIRYSHYLGSYWRFMRNQANAVNADFFPDNGKIYVIPTTGYLPGEVVNLSPTTGLTGIPKVTPEGIEAQCLLNPKLRISGLVHIDSSLLSNVPYEPGATNPWQSMGPEPYPFPQTLGSYALASPAISPTGMYKILMITHHGDTRGNPWNTEIICVAAGDNGGLLGNPGTAFVRSAYGAGGALNAPPIPPVPAQPPPIPPPIPDPPPLPSSRGRRG